MWVYSESLWGILKIITKMFPCKNKLYILQHKFYWKKSILKVKVRSKKQTNKQKDVVGTFSMTDDSFVNWKDMFVFIYKLVT